MLDCGPTTHKIIRKRVALLSDESVSVVSVGTGPAPTGDPSMRVYIIGNDGIILCREPPAAACAAQHPCRVHIALHGCKQNFQTVRARYSNMLAITSGPTLIV